MPGETLIRNGRVFDGRGFRKVDLLVAGEKVRRWIEPGRRRPAAFDTTIDAAGCLVLPGAVDPHVHFQLDVGGGRATCDDFSAGSATAAAAGVTSFIDYTAPRPGEGPLSSFRRRRGQADGRVFCDYSLHNVLIDWHPAWSRELAALVRAGAPSVKVFLIYRDRGWQSDEGRLLEIMSACSVRGLLVCVHAENEPLIEHFSKRVAALPRRRRPGALGLALSRPPLCEEMAAAQAILLAGATGAHLHLVHLSTAGAAALVGAARQSGIRASGETCPQYLVLDRERLAERDGHRFACCPPLRDGTDRRGLWRALAAGMLDALATDHCAFDLAAKDSWGGDLSRLAFGLPGVATSLRLTFTYGVRAGLIPAARWAFLHSEGPARRFGLFPQKGSLRPGADADIILWDPIHRERLGSTAVANPCDFSPYAGRILHGCPRRVLLRGRTVAEEGRLLPAPPRGRFLPRRPPA